MALFNKLFSSHKRKPITSPTATPNQTTTKKFPFSNEQVRILLFRECDVRGKKLLFDSIGIQNVSEQQNIIGDKQQKRSSYTSTASTISHIELSNGYRYIRPDGDHNNISEMIFGSVAMAFRGASLKVHWLQSPTRLLCSEVFLSPIHANKFSDNFLNSTTDGFMSATSNSNSSERNSMDSSSLNSFSLSVSVCISDNMNALGDDGEKTNNTNPLDVPSQNNYTSIAPSPLPPSHHNHHTTSSLAGDASSSDGLRTSSIAYSDSGYGGTDPWTNTSCSSYCRYSSTRSSVGSMYSERENRRKLSVDSSIADLTGLQSVNGASGRNDVNLQRRILRNMSTSFENRLSSSDFIGYFDDNLPVQQQQHSMSYTSPNGGSDGCVIRTRRCSEQIEVRSNPEMFRRRAAAGGYPPKMRSSNRRAKLGLAICIKLSDSFEDDMQRFCSEHIALLESMLCRLRANVENAYINKKNFYQVMFHAWFGTAEWLSDLFMAPRLEKPVWLSLSNGCCLQPEKLAHNFMIDLSWLLNCADTKDTNFFVSTLLTAILTHHLGWVGTVAPLSNCNPILSTHNAAAIDREAKAKMSEISKFHPYNALWAQLSDLYGSIGNPSKISKTIVCGNHRIAIAKVLNILTYFIRCGEIRREQKTEIIDKDVIDTILVDWEESKNEFLAMEHQQTLTKMHKNEDAITDERRSSGLTRASTCMKDLSSLTAAATESSSSGACCSGIVNDSVDDKLMTSSGGSAMPMINNNILVTFKRNDIPNVFIFRDSRFVRQELRIGNTLMDGIERVPVAIQTNRKFQLKTSAAPTAAANDGIKLLVTSPDNEEINFYQTTDTDKISDEPILDEEVEEAKEDTRLNSLALLWGIEPIQRLKKGLNILSNYGEEKQQGFDEVVELCDVTTTSAANTTTKETTVIDSIELKRSKSLYTKSNNPRNINHIKRPPPPTQLMTTSAATTSDLSRKPSISNIAGSLECLDDDSDSSSSIMLTSCPSLSDLITANSVGISERFTWGIERVKEAVSYEEEKHFEFAKQMIEKNRESASSSSDVVFVLGENEALVGLKHCDECPNSNKQQQRLNEMKLSNENSKQFSAVRRPHHHHQSSPKNVQPKQQKQIQLINLPMPKYSTKDNNCSKIDTAAAVQDVSGFVPSLFIGVTDHYIADFVLQGTIAPPSSWENNLKQNLALSAHCATIEQNPTENIAIIANTENWDVKIISSQTSALTNSNAGGSKSGSIGMSQLVSSMLETVHAMWQAGTGAYQCMSYMESKLQELYLHSETLAAFLLATEFCSINNITSSLNLSENDVPLLLAVASIHSPQVSKKCGVGFW